MARARKMTPSERERVERTIRALLASCVKEHGGLWPGANDYAEAHGIYRTLRDLHFEDAETLWHRLQKEAAQGAR